MKNNIGYYVIITASIVVVLAGIKSAAPLIVPFLLSLFLAIILSPLYNYFCKKGLKSIFSLTIVLSLFLVVIGAVIKLLGSSVEDFITNISFYEKQLSLHLDSLESLLSYIGVEISLDNFSGFLHSKQMLLFTTNLIQSLGTMVTSSFVILLTLIFMILESRAFFSKVVYISKGSNSVVHLEEIVKKIQDYMVLKSMISFFTGIIIWIALSLVGTEYAFLWAVMAFMFNFIPNIGSIIAAVPAVLLTLVQLGFFYSFVVASIYFVVNIVIGSIIEPRIMGNGFGLSTLVVFLSLLFWGWLLGAVGMLLSIPLTIMLKIILDSDSNTRWLGIILDSKEHIKK